MLGLRNGSLSLANVSTICLLILGILKKLNKLFLKNNIFAPFVAALVGLIPSCGASIALTEFYLSEIITLGTAIGGLLTGAGVGLVILFKQNKNIKENISIVLLIYFIGAIVGTILNIIGL